MQRQRPMKTHNIDLEFESRAYSGYAAISAVNNLANVEVTGDVAEENRVYVFSLSKI